ncbi:Calmodulin-binding transcription activator 4 [Camellia lanceoleosa]|uniref:Calmodulin-binding transcription activator 4 n=1 Tax=Camellia lanceoleosa TaxID=1840588 RepID=A0ACC0IAU7_9ERIC|nr:Calmodulin-binding transcription activator 4 [Camellia lanceoleosa]
MVASLIASGASTEAVTDPTSQDPTGKTPAFIASTNGHKGLAGYLSEVELTSHISSLKLVENELSKGSAENTFQSQDDTSGVRAHSFKRRQQRDASSAAAIASVDESDILSNDIQGISVASKLAFRNARDYNTAALSIQKKFRGWKGRKDFLAFRQKVVTIQSLSLAREMDSKEKIELIQLITQQLMDDQRYNALSSSPDETSFAVNGEDHHRLLLCRLLSQHLTVSIITAVRESTDIIIASTIALLLPLIKTHASSGTPTHIVVPPHAALTGPLETVKGDDGKLQQPEPPADPKEVPSPAVVDSNNETAKETEGGSIDDGVRKEIVKELRNVKRQNFITHCLLSAMIVLTITWQISKVSLVLSLKDGLSHPFKTFGGMLAGMLKGPVLDAQNGEKKSSTKQPQVEVPAIPPLKISELPLLDLPLGLDCDKD